MRTIIKYKLNKATAELMAFNFECPVNTHQTFEFDALGEVKSKLMRVGALVNAQEGIITLENPYLYCREGNRRKWKEREVSYLLNEGNIELFLERLEVDILASNKYAEGIAQFKAIVGDTMSGTIVHGIADERIAEEDLIVLVGIADKVANLHPTFLEEKFRLRGFTEDAIRARAREIIISSLDVEGAREIEGAFSKWRDDYIILLEGKLRNPR